MKEIRLYNTAWKGLKVIALASIFVALGIWMISREHYGSDSYIMGWVGTCFFGLGIPIGLFNIFDKRPQIIINENGLWARKSKQDEIKWEQITEAYTSHIYNQQFISIIPNETFTVKTKQYTWAKKLSQALGVQQFNITLGQFDIDEDKLCELINSLSNAEKEDRKRILDDFEVRPKKKIQISSKKVLLYLAISILTLLISSSGMTGFMAVIIGTGVAAFVGRWHFFYGNTKSKAYKYAKVGLILGVVNFLLLGALVQAKKYLKNKNEKTTYFLTELGSYDFRRSYFGVENMTGDSLETFMNRNPEGGGFTNEEYYDALVENEIIIDNCLNLSKLDTLPDTFEYHFSKEIKMAVSVMPLQFYENKDKIGYILNFNLEGKPILTDTLEYNFPPDVEFSIKDINNDSKDELLALYQHYAINGDNYELKVYTLD